ncbi:hypothetical protein F511_36847 [Dorcoceras hygrometricum]|uniref:Uncharacterized protein n=1 Tax=Dorcoceras hygrometricum TaxID=472368 RepID=A0A2Z7AS66_9LAMI|nr:hypothetical protein F511_36847 [Dorcoceras hygrometricum]
MTAKYWWLRKAPRAGQILTQNLHPAAPYLVIVNRKRFHCFMADQTSDDEVFDFSNVEFTREDLVSALNDMVKEYRKLSQSFEEAKAENISLKSSSIESSSDELEDIDSLNSQPLVAGLGLYMLYRSGGAFRGGRRGDVGY